MEEAGGPVIDLAGVADRQDVAAGGQWLGGGEARGLGLGVQSDAGPGAVQPGLGDLQVHGVQHDPPLGRPRRQGDLHGPLESEGLGVRGDGEVVSERRDAERKLGVDGRLGGGRDRQGRDDNEDFHGLGFTTPGERRQDDRSRIGNPQASPEAVQWT
jgi:hypothetical protein